MRGNVDDLVAVLMMARDLSPRVWHCDDCVADAEDPNEEECGCDTPDWEALRIPVQSRLKELRRELRRRCEITILNAALRIVVRRLEGDEE